MHLLIVALLAFYALNATHTHLHCLCTLLCLLNLKVKQNRIELNLTQTQTHTHRRTHTMTLSSARWHAHKSMLIYFSYAYETCINILRVQQCVCAICVIGRKTLAPLTAPTSKCHLSSMSGIPKLMAMDFALSQLECWAAKVLRADKWARAERLYLLFVINYEPIHEIIDLGIDLL